MHSGLNDADCAGRDDDAWRRELQQPPPPACRHVDGGVGGGGDGLRSSALPPSPHVLLSLSNYSEQPVSPCMRQSPWASRESRVACRMSHMRGCQRHGSKSVWKHRLRSNPVLVRCALGLGKRNGRGAGKPGGAVIGVPDGSSAHVGAFFTCLTFAFKPSRHHDHPHHHHRQNDPRFGC